MISCNLRVFFYVDKNKREWTLYWPIICEVFFFLIKDFKIKHYRIFDSSWNASHSQLAHVWSFSVWTEDFRFCDMLRACARRASLARQKQITADHTEQKLQRNMSSSVSRVWHNWIIRDVMMARRHRHRCVLNWIELPLHVYVEWWRFGAYSTSHSK